MRKRLYRLAALFAAMVLLTACGGGSKTTEAPETEEDENVGRYYLVAEDGKYLDGPDEESYLRLKDGREAALQLGGRGTNYKWKAKDGVLTLTLDKEKTEGSIADGVIEISLDGSELIFVKGRSAARKYIEAHAGSTEAPTAASTDAPTAASTEAPTQAPAESSASPTEPPETTQSGKPFEPDVRFSATDQYGNTIDETVFRDHVITMINFWEPWCGPCVGEMPELEQLYQDRNGELLILGVYWTEEGAEDVLQETGVTYPVILYDEVFERFQSGYVPTTIFVDSGGHVIGSPYVGARSYDEWNELIKGMIGH